MDSLASSARRSQKAAVNLSIGRSAEVEDLNILYDVPFIVEAEMGGTILIIAIVAGGLWLLFRYLPELKNRTGNSMLDVCLLGSGGMMPLPYRYLTALLTRFNGSSLLIDCGEGTQIAMKEKGWSFKPIDVICFTHYHGDHISGLPGLLLTMGNADRREPLTMIGPKGLERVVSSLRVIAPELPFPVIYKEIQGAEQTFELNGYRWLFYNEIER